MGGTWNAESERLLLLAIIHAQSGAPPDWNKVAKLMGPGYVGNAVRQKFGKLKQAASKQFGEIEDDGEDTSGPSKMGAKRGGKKAASAKAPGSGKKRAAAKQEQDDEEEMQTPTKKVKSQTMEEDDDDDDERL